VTDVVPFLGYEDCATAADWLVRVFGFEEVERIDEGGAVTHVTLRVGDGLVFLGHPGDTYVNPLHLRELCDAAARMYAVPWIVDGVWVAVEDIDAHHDRVRASDARVLSAPADTPHGRQYRVEDLEGHRWMFAQAS
jgi:PhnB protein